MSAKATPSGFAVRLASRSTLITSTFPRRMALSSGVGEKTTLLASSDAPASMSAWTTSTFPLCMAFVSGEKAKGRPASSDAPASMSAWITSLSAYSPRRIALPSGAKRPLPHGGPSSDAPASRSALTTSTFAPWTMADISGDQRLPSSASSDAPASRSALTTSTFAPLTMADISGDQRLPSSASSDAPASRSALTTSTFCPIMAPSSSVKERPFGHSPPSTVCPESISASTFPARAATFGEASPA
eukprot:scaffold107842_cov69-Phaeocystis_antarctica.AAC.5